MATPLGVRRMAIGSLQEILQSPETANATQPSQLESIVQQHIRENGLAGDQEINAFTDYLVQNWNQMQGTNWDPKDLLPRSS